MNKLLEEILKDCSHYAQEGNLANYIPELAKADKNDFGIYIISSNDRSNHAGDWNKAFTIQSIVKPIILLLALMDKGEECVISNE